MKPLSRRDFVRMFGISLGAMLFQSYLSACSNAGLELTPETTSVPTRIPTRQPSETSNPPTETPAAEPPPTDTQEPAPATEPGVTDTPQGTPDLVAARNGDPEDLVRRAIHALGGMGEFVNPGDDVIIKPNICVAYHSYEYAATTNPWVVSALVRLCLEAGAKNVRVLDFPFGGSPDEAYTRSGIGEQVSAAGGEMAYMPGFKYVSRPIPGGKDLKDVEIFDDVLSCDVFIDVPIAKHHSLAKLTLGMKNLLGVIKDRSAMHRNLGQRIADLTSLVLPDLTVVDAVRMLMDHGPTGGSLADVKQADTVIASRDIVAADAYASTLFGMQPSDIEYVVAADAMKLGRSDLENLYIEEI
jgi:uncharacterized protein (DUF362 family)